MVGLGVISWLLLPEAPQLRRRLNLGRLKELAEPQATYERNNSRHKTMQDDTKGSANSANFCLFEPMYIETTAYRSNIFGHCLSFCWLEHDWAYLTILVFPLHCNKLRKVWFDWLKDAVELFQMQHSGMARCEDDLKRRLKSPAGRPCLKLCIGQSLGHLKHLTAVCWDHQTASLLSNIVVVVDFESGMLKQPFFKPGNTCCSAVLEAGNRQLRATCSKSCKVQKDHCQEETDINTPVATGT